MSVGLSNVWSTTPSEHGVKRCRVEPSCVHPLLNIDADEFRLLELPAGQYDGSPVISEHHPTLTSP